MKSGFASVLIIAFVATAIGQQQSTPPAVNQPATSANQGVATNPTGAANTPTQPGTSTTDPTVGAFGGTATNPSGSAAFGGVATNQATGGTAPLFLNVTPTTVTDANGAPIGVLQQLALSPSGAVNFGLVNMGGRLVPVPWQLIVSGTTRGTLGVNTDRSSLQTLPSVLMGHLPMLTQDDVQAAILAHFGLQQPTTTQPTIVTTGTARGGTGGAGVTITGGATNTASFGIMPPTNTTGTNTNGIPNNMRTNQAANTNGGLLSPTGRTNGIFDPYNSGPRQNANPTPPAQSPAPPAANATGQPR